MCPARLPDPHVDRFDEIGRRLFSPRRGEHVADDDRKIADVAGGLRREGFAIIQLRARRSRRDGRGLREAPAFCSSAAICGVAW
jgi:hypothetical protein